ncbi:MAG: hypothetical protein IKP86_07305 [Anaerolineaceae bacterium]|nr:hypothetical protein [Anaerolineaceae bacterium]
MNDLYSKQKKTILIAAAFLALFVVILFFAEWYLFQRDIREDGLFKAESIRKTMADYDSEHQKLLDRISARMITNIKLSAFLIREQMADGTYDGVLDRYEGMFVRIRDGRIELPAGVDDRFKNLQPEDIMTEYSPKTVTSPDGSELMVASARIDDGLYYVTWLGPQDEQDFFDFQKNVNQLLTYVGSAYGGEFFLISNDAPEGKFAARTAGFAEFSSITDLGIKPKNLEKQYFPLKIKSDRYMCYVLPLENREQTAVYCDLINDEIQTGIHRAFTKTLFAGSFLAAMLVLCFSVQQAAAGHTLSGSVTAKYTPERMKQKILIFSLLSGLALMSITVFTTLVQESHHENRKGMSILDSLETQLSESERLAAGAEEMDVSWYIYLGSKISAEATIRLSSRGDGRRFLRSAKPQRCCGAYAGWIC